MSKQSKFISVMEILGFLAFLFIIFSGWQLRIDQLNKQANTIYPAGSVIVITQPVDAKFIVKSAHSEDHLTLNTISLRGYLVVDIPKGYEFLGTSPGSLNINWKQVGKTGGFTQNINEYELTPAPGTSKHQLYFHVSGNLIAEDFLPEK